MQISLETAPNRVQKEEVRESYEEKEKEKEKTAPKEKISKKCLWITIISVIASVVIVGVVAFLVIKIIKDKDKKEAVEEKEEEDSAFIIPKDPKEPIDPGESISQKQKEFDIITRAGDLKQISVVQKSKDETKIDNKIILTENIRKTDYNIYIISESDPDEKHSEYYTKMYTGCVSIRDECTSNTGDCQLQSLMDLTLEPKKSSNSRMLETSEKIRDNPIPLCFFNITDTHIITTIKCHQSFPESQKGQILLDLYFFRPPASQRIDKKGDNITINITEDEITKETHIREINGGLCNIYNNFGSLCTTDMNTTLDSEKNLISYDEEAITTINYDENNSYIKHKVTNLMDFSQNIKKAEVENYKKSLDILIPLIEDYMLDDPQFSDEDFEDFKERYNNKSDRYYIPKKTRNVFRKLDEPKNQYIQETELFSQKAKGIKANIKLEINPGIDSDHVGAYGTFSFDNDTYTFSSLQNISELNTLINQLASISKAANQLATELHDRIIDRLEQVLENITTQMNNLKELLLYYDLFPIFNSTFSLYPYYNLTNDIIKTSNDLLSGLSGIYTQINTGIVSTYGQILHNNVYNYIDGMNLLIVKMLNSLGNLTNTLIEKNNTFTAITNYYLNDTSSSYVNIIQNMKTIFNNYFIYEYNLIFPKVENLIVSFNESTKASLKANLISLKDLYNNLLNGSYIIYNVTNQEYQTVLSNLDNSYKYPSAIISKINNYILEMINLKENGYFISQEDIDNLNKTFYDIFFKADEVAKNLDNVDIIDKVFDEIMTKFRDKYIYTVDYMEQIKSENFKLEEDVLNKTTFAEEIKNKMENEIKKISDEILLKIKISSNFENIKEYLSFFLDEYLDEINILVSDLDLILSEAKLKNLANDFELSLNLTLQKLANETKNNIKLAKDYFDEYFNVLNDTEYLKQFTQKHMVADPTDPSYSYYNNHLNDIHQMIAFDEIKEKEYTYAYLAKYNSFMANLNYTQEYFSNQLYFDIVNTHREIFDKIKEYLNSILNKKLNEKLSDFEEAEFYKNHIKIVDKINSRLNKYFSQNAFDNKYLKVINESINSNKKLIEETKSYINSKHNTIKYFHYYDKDHSNDACIIFKRKVCYGCKNCISYTFFFDRVCFVLLPYQENYLNIKKIEFDSMKNLDDFEENFIEFDAKVNITLEKYNTIMNNLTIYINTLPEEEIKNITIDHFEPLRKWINETLKNKYEDEIIKSVYNYYQPNIKEKLEIIFDDIFNKWQGMYSNLTNDIASNQNDIKYSLFEFSIIGSIYKSIIGQELTKGYYDSIILFQRSEFNYAISYYYNYLIKLIDKSYKYIMNKIQIGEYAVNEAIKERKEELANIYDILIEDIYDTEIIYLTTEKQLNILQVDDDDFFKVKYIMEKNIIETDKKLEKMVEDIAENEEDIGTGDEYSLVMRFYLENKELGKLIQTFYEPIDKGELFSFHLNKFKDIMKENWVFDEGDFIYILNKALFQSNKIIKKELSIKMDNYSAEIEKEINKYIDDSTIEDKIDELYIIKFDSLMKLQEDYINSNILSILNVINQRIKLEGERIANNPKVYLLNSDKIKKNISDYNNLVINKLNSSVFGILDNFNENVYNTIYSNCIKNKLNQFLTEAKNVSFSLEFGEYYLVNSSYKVGEVIYNLTDTIVNDYKNMVMNKIDYKYKEYYDKIKNKLNINETNFYINKIFDNILEDWILKVLNKNNNCSSSQCQEFDFTVETTDEINNIISQKMNNITNLLLSLKGNNFEVNYQCSLDFTNSGKNIIKPICESFKSILSSENQEQGTLINGYIQDYIKNNLDDFLNNVVPNFGNPFFERIIDYNINFKIVDLYRNLRYSLAQTNLYYYILNEVQDVSNLPYELKIRLYRLNDLDTTIKIKKEDIKKLLEKKLSELIDDLKDTAKETYTYHLKENEIIKKKFSPLLLERIDFNLEEIMDDLDKKYQDALEKYLKEKFTLAFEKILQNKTEDMLEVFYLEKDKLMQKFDVLFSSKEDKDLNEVNNKINLTLESIQSYNSFIDTFQISNNVKSFFLNYGNSYLLPLFIQFEKELYNKMKLLIINSINEKSLTIQNLNSNTFNNLIEVIQNDFAKNYYYEINLAIESYGKDDISYGSHLNYTRKTIFERLMNHQNGEDLIEEAKRRAESKDAEETLKALYMRANNNYNGLNNLNTFTYFYNKINNYKNDLALESKKIKEMIAESKYKEEINLFLNEKVDSLLNYLYNYYNQINNRFSSLKTKLSQNISSIRQLLYGREYYTEYYLYYEYDRIKQQTKQINNKYLNYIQKFERQIEYKNEAEHMTNYAYASIYNIEEYFEFKMDLIYNGGIWERPKVKAIIVGKSRPGNVDLDFNFKCGRCCDEGHIYNITLKDSNFTTTVEYDMKTSNIKINTFTNIEKSYYTEIIYRKEQLKKKIEEDYDGITVRLPICLKEENLTIYKNDTKEISAKHFNSGPKNIPI